MNLPNKLTILRMILVPVFVVCFYLPVSYNLYLAAGVFVIAYLTDMLDGQIARRRNMVTDFGKLMDPMADKILSGAAMIMLTAFGMLSPIATILTISREFVISGFRMVYAQKNVIIAAGKLGKLKTMTQFIGVTLMLCGNPLFQLINVPFDQIVVWLSVALAVWSCIDYIVKIKLAEKRAA
jgi:CDP-diacylglycerol--glycerol-3-phosphate 3-phosphatidyltransferase